MQRGILHHTDHPTPCGRELEASSENKHGEHHCSILKSSLHSPDLCRLRQLSLQLLQQSESSWIINMGISALLLIPDISFFTFQCFLGAICHYLVFSFSFSLRIIIQGRKWSTVWEFIQHEWAEMHGLVAVISSQACWEGPAWQAPSWVLCKSLQVKYSSLPTAKSSAGGRFLWTEERVTQHHWSSSLCCSYAVLVWGTDAWFRSVLTTVTTPEMRSSSVSWCQCIAQLYKHRRQGWAVDATSAGQGKTWPGWESSDWNKERIVEGFCFWSALAANLRVYKPPQQ